MAGYGEPDLSTVEAHGLTLGSWPPAGTATWSITWWSGRRLRRRRAASTMRTGTGGRLRRAARRRQALARGHDAVVALGVVIRGETAHFDYVVPVA